MDNTHAKILDVIMPLMCLCYKWIHATRYPYALTQPRNGIAAKTGENTNQVFIVMPAVMGLSTCKPTCLPVKTCSLLWMHLCTTTSYHRFLKKLKQGNHTLRPMSDDAASRRLLVLGEFQWVLQKGLAQCALSFLSHTPLSKKWTELCETRYD